MHEHLYSKLILSAISEQRCSADSSRGEKRKNASDDEDDQQGSTVPSFSPESPPPEEQGGQTGKENAVPDSTATAEANGERDEKAARLESDTKVN